MEDGAVPGPSKTTKREDEARRREGAAAQEAMGKVKKQAPPDKEDEKKNKKKPTKKKKEEPEGKSDTHDGRVDVRQCRLGLIIGQQIGSGSFAKVYKAYSCQKQKDVAVKIFKRSDIPENYFNKFIVREIEVIKELRHRNLVKFYDCQFTTKR